MTNKDWYVIKHNQLTYVYLYKQDLALNSLQWMI